MLRGVRPFFSDKYDLTRHPNFKYTADADPENVFDMERYMKKQRAVVKPTDRFDVYEIDVSRYMRAKAILRVPTVPVPSFYGRMTVFGLPARRS